MSFCPQCGAALNDGMRFCPNCGCALLKAIDGQTNGSGAYSDNSEPAIYRVILLNLGRCNRNQARACLTEYINYSVSDANVILNTLPSEIACNLTVSQAQALAKVMTNYGMQVTVCDENDYVDLGNTTATTDDENGNSNIWAGVLGVLATLGLVNQVKRISRWDRPYVRRHVYGYQPYRPAPPRTMGRAIPPKPPMRNITPRPPMSGFGNGLTRPGRGGRPGGFGGGRGPGGGGRGPGGR